MMSKPLCFEEISVGQTWTSPGRTITETDVVNFASMTGDYNPLHVDKDFAANSHYGRQIAHGLLGVSWVAGLGSNSPNMKTVAFVSLHSWDFLKPLYFGDTVHVETEVINKTLHGRRTGKVQFRRTLINQRDEITQQGVFETIVELKNPVARPNISKSLQEIKPDAVDERS